MSGEQATEVAASAASLKRVPLSEQVRRALLDGLLNGRWRPGDRIIERHIARELDVSHGPVREALRDLQAMQLVDMIPNKGVRVRELTPDYLPAVYPVRAALERLAGQLAVRRLAGDVSELEPHLDLLHQAARDGDSDLQIHCAVEFHREIVRAAGNEVLLRNWESLAIELWTRLSLKWLRTELHENAEDHVAIVDAFRRQDPYVGRMLELHVLDYAHKPMGTP
ncbi:GntR family transcriptional regulator [Streptomyces sp. G44]|uniref:GntR family transcriptional regulator n=1 Tax=Streptomyces sp. G44 TaxID=2807632 RepID=UPI001960B3DC|nr:GntR family transcriptional regulator [Streptomyces sp. G44]MBM7168634.1 GntR family transcriptional regulator [Streptomyces sp. G44]